MSSYMVRHGTNQVSGSDLSAFMDLLANSLFSLSFALPPPRTSIQLENAIGFNRRAYEALYKFCSSNGLKADL